MKRFLSTLVAVAMLTTQLPVMAGAVEEEKDASGDMMDFAADFSAMLDTYGLERPAVYGVDMGEIPADRIEEFRTARLIVKSTQEEIDPMGAVSVVSGFDDLHVLQYASLSEAYEAYQAYEEMDWVQYVQPDTIVTVDTTEGEEMPTSTSYEYWSWGYGSYYMNMDAYAEWLTTNDIEETENILVAVVDTGVDLDHPDLVDRLAANGYDFVETDSTPDDLNSHGTHVAGTVLEGTQSQGSAIKVLPVRVLDETGNGSVLQVCLGIRYAADNGARVINMSLGDKGKQYLEQEAINYAVSKGAVVVVSAGNDNNDSENKSPASLDNVIAVAAAAQIEDSFGVIRATYSNYGDCVDITAPGTGITSTIPSESDSPESNFGVKNGTSMATPHISAAVAMLLRAHPEYTAPEVELRLKQAAVIKVEPYLEIGVPNMLSMAALCDTVAAPTITLSHETVKAYPGQVFTLSAASNSGGAVTWSSSDAALATVDTNGTVTVTGAADNTVTITATQAGTAVSCTVTIVDLEITLPSTIDVPVGGSGELLATANCDFTNFTWSSSDQDTVKLYSEYNADGTGNYASSLVTSGMIYFDVLTEAEADITVSVGEVSKTCTVHVVDAWGADENYSIDSADELMAMARTLNAGVYSDYLKGKTVTLSADIDLGGYAWDPINMFSGTFDGGKHTISGLSIASADGNYIGLFETIDEGGIVRNLNVTGNIVRQETVWRSYLGGISAENYGSIENCTFTGKVIGESYEYVGGIVGYSEGQVIGCVNNAEVRGKKYVGGIAGYSKGQIADCENHGAVSGTDGWIAGIVGSARMPVSGCTNTGTITGATFNVAGIVGYTTASVSDCTNSGTIGTMNDDGFRVGGIAAYVDASEVYDCTNSGAVCGYEDVGGICGLTDSVGIYSCANNGMVETTGGSSVGGIAGSAFSSYVFDCTNSAAISGSNIVGGIVGYTYASEVYDCTNGGPVCGYEYVGGIVGYAVDSDVYDCTNNGSVSANDYIGGIIGCVDSNTNYGSLFNCINSGTVTGVAGAGGICGAFFPQQGIINCLNTGTVTGNGWLGGIVAYSEGFLQNCVNTAEVCSPQGYTEASLAGWLAGYARNCYATQGEFFADEDVYERAENVRTFDQNLRLSGIVSLYHADRGYYYEGDSLLDALNAWSLNEYIVNGTSDELRNYFFWTQNNGMLQKCTVVMPEDQEMEFNWDHTEKQLVVATYNGERMAQVRFYDPSVGHLVQLDRGETLRFFWLDKVFWGLAG